ncbi:UNVERIFIED_CONTAM: putative magnesium transporter NIPA4 [Sesamum angustifolium]|uniref:Probable magnesium transporter n=1 Tax=Sesamum angustifolium TaxID=2727405 RepID=A0AAW2NZJ8_9LAMI
MASNDANSISYRGMSSDNIKGLVLALSSSFFIGASFIIKKKGLKKAGASGVRAGLLVQNCSQGIFLVARNLHDILLQEGVGEEVYVAGMMNLTTADSFWDVQFAALEILVCFHYVDIFGQSAVGCPRLFFGRLMVSETEYSIDLSVVATVIVGENCKFCSLCICTSHPGYPSCAVLAHVILRERLHIFGVLGCALCVVGSTTIVLHAPQEREIESVTEVWDLATEPAFVFYAVLVIGTVLILIFRYVPQYGQTHIWFYIGVCSLVGSLSVMSVKALGIALKLTLSGMNQLTYPQTWVFAMVVIVCVLTQMNYLNKALDTFNTAVVSPIYYVMFTSLTIVASVIMFKDWDRQNPTQIVTELCGFVTILSGTFLLHRTKDMTDGSMVASRLAKHGNEDGFGDEGIPLRRQDSSRTP